MKDGRTALLRACVLGLLNLVLLLVGHGANVNAETQRGRPVHAATNKNRPHIIEWLAQHCARLNVVSATYEHLLLIAVRRGYEEVAKTLLLNGIDLNAREIKEITPQALHQL